MSLENSKYYCPQCWAWIDADDTEIRRIRETFPVKGENIESESEVRFCKKCGNDLFDDFLDPINLNRAFDEYKRRHNLLTSSEVKRIREKYRISPRIFSKILSFDDEKSIERFERNSIQSFAQNHLIVLADSPDNFRIMLDQSYAYGCLTHDEYTFVQTASEGL